MSSFQKPVSTLLSDTPPLQTDYILSPPLIWTQLSHLTNQKAVITKFQKRFLKASLNKKLLHRSFKCHNTLFPRQGLRPVPRARTPRHVHTAQGIAIHFRRKGQISYWDLVLSGWILSASQSPEPKFYVAHRSGTVVPSWPATVGFFFFWCVFC